MLVTPGSVLAQEDPSASPPAVQSPGAESPAAGTPEPGASAVAGDRIPLPNGWLPEGITSNGDVLYAGSRADGAVWRGSATGGTGEVFVQGVEGRVAVGVDYEAAHDRLWVAGGPTGRISAYDATSGEQLGEWQYEGAGFLNDLVATPGAVYATDSMSPDLKVVPLAEDGSLPAADGGTTLPLTGAYQQVEGFNNNGIVWADGQLITVQSATGTLYRVDPTTGEATVIDTGGYAVTNGDGLELVGTDLYVVRNQLNMVALLALDQTLESASLVGEITSPDLDVPTTAAWSGEFLYAVNARFNTEPTPDTEYWITRLPLEPTEAPEESLPPAAASPAAASPAAASPAAPDASESPAG
jgi:hypothetical protein